MRQLSTYLLITLFIAPLFASAYVVDTSYIGVLGGVNYLQSVEAKSTTAMGSVRFKDGTSYGAEFGHQMDDVRYELEGYHFTSTVRTSDKVAGERDEADGTLLFANGIFYPMTGPRYYIEPYFGGGLGLANFKLPTIRVGGVNVPSKTRTTVALQAIAGLDWKLNHAIDVLADYRFIFGARTGFYDAAGVEGKNKIMMHTLNLGLQFRF